MRGREAAGLLNTATEGAGWGEEEAADFASHLAQRAITTIRTSAPTTAATTIMMVSVRSSVEQLHSNR